MKILISENSKKIKDFTDSFKAELDRTQNILDRIWKHHKGDLPEDHKEFLKGLYLQNPAVASASQWMRIDLDSSDFILPDNIRELKVAFGGLHSGPILRFFSRSKSGWIKDQQAITDYIESFAEGHRVYAETPEELERYRKSKTYCDIVTDLAKEQGVDLKYGDYMGTFKNKVKNFLIEFHEYKFRPSVHWIKTGKMQVTLS